MYYKNKCTKICGSNASLRCNTRSHEIYLLIYFKGITEEITLAKIRIFLIWWVFFSQCYGTVFAQEKPGNWSIKEFWIINLSEVSVERFLFNSLKGKKSSTNKYWDTKTKPYFCEMTKFSKNKGIEKVKRCLSMSRVKLLLLLCIIDILWV